MEVPPSPKFHNHVIGEQLVLRSVKLTAKGIQPLSGAPIKAALGDLAGQLAGVSGIIAAGPQELFITLRDIISFPPAVSEAVSARLLTPFGSA